MELNEIHNEGEHATVSMKALLLVFAVVLVGTLGYFVWQQNTEVDTTDYSTQVVKKSSTAKTALACGDTTKYGFSMTLGTKWTGYEIYEVLQKDMTPQPGYALVTCYFTMPTTTTDPVWTAAGPDHLAKYASVFAVSVYTPAQWIEAEKEASPPTKLASNTDYVWGWSSAQALPTDLQTAKIADDVKNVVATFAVVK